MYRFIFLFFFFAAVQIVVVPQTYALSCIQESLQDAITAGANVDVVKTLELTNSNREGLMSAVFTWNVQTITIANGSAGSIFTIRDEVWPGGTETQSRLQVGKMYLIVYDDNKVMGMCRYPRDVDAQPLTDQERNLIMKDGGQVEVPSCQPYMCTDGSTFASCSEDGHVIAYFAPPCLTHGGDATPGNTNTDTASMYFLDVPVTTSYYEAINWAFKQGVLKGYPDKTFRPTQQITRAEFLKILLVTSYGEPALYAEHFFDTPGFTDVSQDAWYYQHVLFAWQKYIIAGYSDNTFKPQHSINFAEAAKIVVLTKNLPLAAVSTANWWESFVQTLRVFNALPVSYRSADQFITRAEMVEIMYRLQMNTTSNNINAYIPDNCTWKNVVNYGWQVKGWDCVDSKETLVANANGFGIHTENEEDYTRIEVISIPEGMTATEVLQQKFMNTPDSMHSCFITEYNPGESLRTNMNRLVISSTAQSWENFESCGPYGATNAVQYFEIHQNNPKSFLFVRIGQDSPPFDPNSIVYISESY